MSALPLWLILVMSFTGVHLHMVTYMEMLLSDPRQAVHRVEQDSSSGIQKIKITLDSDRVVAVNNEHPLSVLPLSIESVSSHSHENAGPSNGGSRETLSKRQATASQPTVKQPSKPPAAVNPSQPAARYNQPDVKKTPTQAMPPKTEPKNQKIASSPKPEVKQNVKIEPKTNQYGIGSTLVLTVKTEDNGEPSYVDQTQPHKLAKPLRYDSQVGPERVENNYQTTTYREPLEKDGARAPLRETRPTDQNLPQIIYQQNFQSSKPIPQSHEQTPNAKENVPVYDEYYTQNREQPGSVKPARPEGYERYDQNRPVVGNPKPQFNAASYEESDENIRNEKKRPSDYEVNYNREVPSSATRRPIYEETYTSEPQHKIYKPDPVEDSYIVDRPVQSQRPSRPVNSEGRVPVRPPYEEDTYVDLRPSYGNQQDNRRPSNSHDDSEYSGFPESFQPNRHPTASQPLQYDPPRVFPPSPCHSVFKYEGREPNNDNWSGDIYVSTDEVLVGMRLDITLDRPARLLANWMSEVKTKDNVHFTILSLRKRLVPGPAETVRILVRFHPDGPIPFVQSINLNGRRICPVNKPSDNTYVKPTTRRPVFENPGDFQTKTPTELYLEPSSSPDGVYEERPRPTTSRITRAPERRTTTEPYQPPRHTTANYIPILRPGPNPDIIEPSQSNRVPTPRPASGSKPEVSDFSVNNGIPCGKPSVQPRPLVTHGQMTARGQWPWHAAIYKNVGIDLSYICGGSLISSKHVVTAAHCVTQTYDVKPLDANVIVVYLGKYHLKLWSEGGVQNKQVSAVKVHPEYNNTDFRADLAVLVLSSPVEFTEYIRPVCLWDRRKADISEVENKEGTVIGWGFDEAKRLTEELMQAKMPVIKHDVCLWSYPEFFPQFTSNLTYCAGFRNGTSVCNGDSGGGMVFPLRAEGEERWYLRGLVSISVSEKENRVCDTKHYVVFTDVAKFLDWLGNFV